MRKNRGEWERLIQLLREEKDLEFLLKTLEGIDGVKAEAMLIAVRIELKDYTFDEIEIVRRLLLDNKSISDLHEELVEKNEIDKRIRRIRQSAEHEVSNRAFRKRLEEQDEFTFLEFLLLSLLLKQFDKNNVTDLTCLLLLQFFAEDKPQKINGV
jgi:hypothetical protein